MLAVNQPVAKVNGGPRPIRAPEALTGFSDRRLELFLNLGRQYFTVHETASPRHRRHEAGALEPGAPAG